MVTLLFSVDRRQIKQGAWTYPPLSANLDVNSVDAKGLFCSFPEALFNHDFECNAICLWPNQMDKEDEWRIKKAQEPLETQVWQILKADWLKFSCVWFSVPRFGVTNVLMGPYLTSLILYNWFQRNTNAFRTTSSGRENNVYFAKDVQVVESGLPKKKHVLTKAQI